MQVLAVQVGPEGKPDARVAQFQDNTLADAAYSYQGRRYALSQALAPNATTTVTTSLWVPYDWVTNTPNTTCTVNCTACTGWPCSRYVQVAVDLGLQEGGELGWGGA